VEEFYQTDAVDKRIVTELQRDASLSHAELAARVSSSPASVWRRVRALEKAGVLGGSVRMVNADKVGCGVNVLCNIRNRSHTVEVRAEFEDSVRSRPEILECFSMSGDWDYLLRIVVPDVRAYEVFLMRVLLDHPSICRAARPWTPGSGSGRRKPKAALRAVKRAACSPQRGGVSSADRPGRFWEQGAESRSP
jgi:Lrp/AsnC family transcriptional regulator